MQEATRIVVLSRVIKIEKRITHVWVTGIGENAVFRENDHGYYMTLEGSHESIHVGFTNPSLKAGDKIKITFEKV